MHVHRSTLDDGLTAVGDYSVGAVGSPIEGEALLERQAAALVLFDQPRQLGGHVFERGVEAQDLLVQRDRLGIEAVSGVAFGELAVDTHRPVAVAGHPDGSPVIGEATIEAALNPEDSDFIFFVADGTGGHAFAATLAEHNRNVARWREIEAERSDGN